MTHNEFRGELEKLPARDFVVVGLGNEMRGDDKTGVLIAEKGAAEFPSKFINAGISIENYIFKITSRPEKKVIIADAVDFGGSPGDVKVFPAASLSDGGISTHSLGIKRLGFFFDEAGQEIFILAVQPATTAMDDAMTPEVEKSAEIILDFFRKKLNTA